MTSSDYGDEIEWDDTLETQLQAIESAPGPPINTGPPHIEVILEAPPTASTSALQPTPTVLAEALAVLGGMQEQPERKKSLWERYRKRRGWGALSVSDLVGPSWCEVQHAYRLGSKAHLPPSQRPTEIISSTGALIPLDLQRTVAREVILDKGKAVHSVLEKEVMGDAEPVKVAVVGKEQWWALRLLNTMVALETLLETGRAREIPVVGFVDEFLVFGVIDEVDRREFIIPPPTASSSAPPPPPLPATAAPPTTSNPTKEKASDGQTTIAQYFSPVASPSGKGKERAVDQPAAIDPPSVRWGFIVSDTKTRYNRSLPSKGESRAARLQIMLYRRLLSSLLSRASPTDFLDAPDPRQPFPWPRLYAHLSLDPLAPFPPPFLASIQPILIGSSLEAFLGPAKNLAEFVLVLQRYGDLLGGSPTQDPLDSKLEISYRLRNTVKRWKPKRKTQQQLEQEDLERAIKASLEAEREGGPTGDDEAVELERAIAMSLGQMVDGGGSQETVVDGLRSAMEEDEQEVFPFVGDPSLLLPNDSMDLDPSSSDLLIDDIDLPPNSQVDCGSAVPRYNLRRRRTAPLSNLIDLALSDPDSPPRTPKRQKPSPPPNVVPPPQTPPPPPPTAPLPPSSPEEVLEGTLIGTESFEYDEGELSRWLDGVVKLWKGEREPEGVSLEQTSRCRTCEFESGCEWRERKAKEAVERNKARMAK